jgi:hypothetical protein
MNTTTTVTHFATFDAFEATRHGRGLAPDSFYVITETGQALWSPDGRGVVSYDSLTDARAEHG